MIFELATLQCTLMGDKLRLSSASLSGIKGAAMEHGQSGGIAASNLHYGRRYGQRLQWCLLAIAFVVTFVFLVVFSTDRFAAWKVPSAYLLLLAAPASLPLSARIASFGPSPAPTGLLLIGTLFVVGGASLDCGATIWHTPDLSREANVIARALLDSGHSLGFVTAAGVLGQITFGATVVCGWAGLLRHRHPIIADMPAGGAFIPTLKAATCGAHLTLRQWILPLRYTELPDAYHLWWVLVVVFVAGSAYRWHLGLEWCGVVPVSWTCRMAVIAVAVVSGVTAYIVWLSSANRSGQVR